MAGECKRNRMCLIGIIEYEESIDPAVYAIIWATSSVMEAWASEWVEKNRLENNPVNLCSAKMQTKLPSRLIDEENYAK